MRSEKLLARQFQGILAATSFAVGLPNALTTPQSHRQPSETACLPINRSQLSRLRSTKQKYWIALAAVVFAVAMLPMSFKKPAAADWLNTYVLAGQEMLARQPIHSAGKNSLGAGPFTYPPAAALLAVPFARTSPTVALAGWYVASVLATFVAVACAWRLVGAPKLSRRSTRDWSWIFALGLVPRRASAHLSVRQSTDRYVRRRRGARRLLAPRERARHSRRNLDRCSRRRSKPHHCFSRRICSGAAAGAPRPCWSPSRVA